MKLVTPIRLEGIEGSFVEYTGLWQKNSINKRFC